jgi:hypothetical protein
VVAPPPDAGKAGKVISILEFSVLRTTLPFVTPTNIPDAPSIRMGSAVGIAVESGPPAEVAKVIGDDVIGDGYVSLRVVAVSGEPVVSS